MISVDKYAVLEVLQESRDRWANSARAQERLCVRNVNIEFEFRSLLYRKTWQDKGIGQGVVMG